MLRKIKTRSRSIAGFTLVELMLVLGIMVMMMAVSIPAVDAFMRNKGPDAAARVVRGALFGAKMKAIRDREKIAFDARPVGSIYGFQVRTATSGLKSVVKAEDNPQWLSNYFKGKYLRRRHVFDLSGSGDVKRSGLITSNTSSTITCRLSGVQTGEMVDIVEDEHTRQLAVTPDHKSEVWEMMPEWVDLTAWRHPNIMSSALPLYFKADGSLDALTYEVRMLITDMRLSRDTKEQLRTAVNIKITRNTGAIRRVEKW